MAFEFWPSVSLSFSAKNLTVPKLLLFRFLASPLHVSKPGFQRREIKKNFWTGLGYTAEHPNDVILRSRVPKQSAVRQEQCHQRCRAAVGLRDSGSWKSPCVRVNPNHEQDTILLTLHVVENPPGQNSTCPTRVFRRQSCTCLMKFAKKSRRVAAFRKALPTSSSFFGSIVQ